MTNLKVSDPGDTAQRLQQEKENLLKEKEAELLNKLTQAAKNPNFEVDEALIKAAKGDAGAEDHRSRDVAKLFEKAMEEDLKRGE